MFITPLEDRCECQVDGSADNSNKQTNCFSFPKRRAVSEADEIKRPNCVERIHLLWTLGNCPDVRYESRVAFDLCRMKSQLFSEPLSSG